MNKNILIVEDDIALAKGIALALKANNYTILTTHTLKDANFLTTTTEFDLVILDINLPDGNGLDFLVKYKHQSSCKFIVLTANDLETDVVTGLEMGADDYMTKPFSLMILRARVHARLRNTSKSTVYKIGPYQFNFEKMLFYKNEDLIELSKTEQKLLKILINNKGHNITRETLIDKIWTQDIDYVDENALSVTIKRLRDKLEDNPSKPNYIKTIYGIGYTWVIQ